MNNIDIVDYDPNWSKIFDVESKKIKTALKDNCLAIYHFGSTSVPGLSSKPKIDILAVVKSFKNVDNSSLEKLGFEVRGEIIPTGRYFSKKNPKVHLHIFEEKNPLIDKNLRFRDWLREHDDDRDKYANLKKKLATEHTDGMKYCYAKSDFIDEILKKSE